MPVRTYKDISMSEPKKERNFLEAVLEGSEAAIDLVSDNEVVKAVPVIGTAIKMLKGWDDMRSRMLVAKLSRFLDEPALRTAAAARKVREGLLLDEVHDQEMGETIFMVIDKVTDMTKPILLAKMFAAYLDGVINRDFFLMLAHAIDISSVYDMNMMITQGRSTMFQMIEMRTLWRERLGATGLYVPQFSGSLEALDYKLAPLGIAFLAALDHCARSNP
jgi:hypothetical protein